ncbi:MAG: rhomboid family intramembrane serine protease [Candidatus Bathyarchaeia archaeon]
MFSFKRSLGVPVGGYSRVRSRPIVTFTLIIVNTAIYFITSYQNLFMEISDYWVNLGGFVPSLITIPTQFYRILSSMFLHANLFHIIFNMYFLYLFGRAVEEALGGGRFLALYLASGIFASIFHTAFSFIGGYPAYLIPAIGASGAISGVLGAYLLLYPGTSLIMGWWFFPFPFFIRLKAVYYLIFWFATQVIYGYLQAAGSTAVFAHAGGFIAGIALLPMVTDRDRLLQLRLTSRISPPYYLIFAPVMKSTGLGRTAKVIISIVLASLLIGASYASTGLADPGDVKSTSVQYTCGGASYIDYVGFQLPKIDEVISAISFDATRILLNRLYAAGLLYDATKANRELTIIGETFKVPVAIKISGSIISTEVNITINNFTGIYDADGFLKRGEGDIATQAVSFQVAYGPGYNPYPVISYKPISYKFSVESQTVKLANLTQYTALTSLAVTATAIAVILTKDKELTIIGEEPTFYEPYFGLPV